MANGRGMQPPWIRLVAPMNEFVALMNELAAPKIKLVAPMNEFAARINEPVAPINEFVAPMNEFVAPMNEFVVPMNEFVAPINKLVAPLIMTKPKSVRAVCSKKPAKSPFLMKIPPATWLRCPRHRQFAHLFDGVRVATRRRRHLLAGVPPSATVFPSWKCCWW